MTAPTLLQTGVEQATAVAAQLLGLAVLAGTLAAVVAMVYRWASRETVPLGLALLVGLSGVAVYLNTTTALGQAIGGDTAPTADVGVALFNIGAFVAGGLGASAGQRAGDRFGTDVLLRSETSDVDEEVNRLVRTVGRVVTVRIPDEVDDVTGYDPVSGVTKEILAGKKFVFPRSLTVSELRERLVSRLKTDYGVGTVDLELADDGSVEYLAVGSRPAGIGPTLPPATNAVAIRADPAFSASAGDVVQVWETDPMRRVTTAELRAVADDVVTIAIDAADTPKIDPRRRYRLVTLPVEDRPEREFASLLRAAEETFSTVTVEAGSPLHGLPVGALRPKIVAVRPQEEGATPIALPEDDHVLSPGDTVFAIARPDALRRLETAAEPLDPLPVRGPAPGDEPEATPGGEQAEPADGTGDRSEGIPSSGEDTAERPAAGDEPGPAEPERPSTGEPIADDDGIAGKAEAHTFDDLKAEFESGDAGWDDDEAESEPVETVAADGEDEGDSPDDVGGSSFDELKSEFESGDADWEETSSETDDDQPAEKQADEAGDDGSAVPDDGGDDLVGLDDADIAFEDDDPGDGAPEESVDPFDADDDLEAIDLDEGGDEETLDFGDDDVLGLDLDEEEDSLSFDEDADATERNEEGDSDDSEGDDDDDSEDDDDGDSEDDDDDGGSKSFAQLKEEFESGDADWEDDVSDSPGGDMRLDE